MVVERECPAGRGEGAFKIKAPLHDGIPQIGPRIGGIAGEIHAFGGEGQFGRRRGGGTDCRSPDSVMGAPPICPVKTMSDKPPDEERPLTVALIS